MTDSINPFSFTSNNNSPQNILDILLNEKLLTLTQVQEIKIKYANTGKSIESILLEENLISPEKIAEAKAQLFGIPFLNLNNTSFSPEAMHFIPRVVADRFQLIPISYNGQTKTISIAMGNPADLEAVQFVRQKTGLNVKVFAASAQQVLDNIALQYRQELVGQVGEAIKETEELTKKTQVVDSANLGEIIKEAPIAKIVSTI